MLRKLNKAMRKYIKETVILLLQLLMFYLFPLFAGPTDAMGMVFLMLPATVLLSLVLGMISCRRIKYLYPAAIALLFVPSVWIHYNQSALVHALWYFAVSAAGLLTGALLRRLFCGIFRR